MILADPNISPSTISTVVGYLAQHTRVCAKLLDRDGRIVAVNKVGLELLQREADAICGLQWVSLWDSDERAGVEAALDEAFGGASRRLVAELRVGGRPATWEIEMIPCDWSEGAVSRVLVLSTPLAGEAARDGGASRGTAEGSREIIEALNQALHTVANLSTAATGAANILRRGVEGDRIALLANSLEDSGLAAARAIAELREAVGRNGGPA